MTDVDQAGALLRLALPTTGQHVLPPVPGGHDVTLSFCSASVAATHADVLRQLGYRVVGVRAASPSHPRESPSRSRDVPSTEAMVDVVVPGHVRAAEPAWWRALLERADEAYSLAFGPVRATLGHVLRAHLDLS